MLYCFWSVTNINPDDILQIIVDKNMEIVALLFKQVLLMIIGYVTGIVKKHNINAKGCTEAELICADDSIPQIISTP